MNILLRPVNKFLRWCPGALGILLRQKFYPYLLGSCGNRVIFGRFIEFRNPQNINVANDSVISNRCILHAGDENDGSSSIIIETGVFLGIGTSLQALNSSIHLKGGANLGSECSVVAKAPIMIGKNVLIAAYCLIGPEKTSSQRSGGAINISDDVWLGARSQVLPDVQIGEGAIIGAHATVDSSISAFGIAAGCPASVMKYREKTA